MVDSGQCSVDYVPTRDMVADALTKPLSREPHERHANSMGLTFHESEYHWCAFCYGVFPSRNQLHAHVKLHNHHVDEVFPTPRSFCQLATGCVFFSDIHFFVLFQPLLLQCDQSCLHSDYFYFYFSIFLFFFEIVTTAHSYRTLACSGEVPSMPDPHLL